MKKIIASNFKTNHNRQVARSFINHVDVVLSHATKNCCDVVIFPSLIALDYFSLHSDLEIGAQNCYPVSNGSMTGEIGSEQLEEFDITTILIGHSERRQFLKESQDDIIAKYSYFQNLGYKIFYCIGEPLEIRKQGLDSTMQYLLSQLQGIDLNYPNLVIAYEPIWAIGNGVSANIEDIIEVHANLKKTITQPLLYGGSVNLKNIESIMKLDCVDGVLIGSASWNIDDFCKMIEIVNEGENEC